MRATTDKEATSSVRVRGSGQPNGLRNTFSSISLTPKLHATQLREQTVWACHR